jgi:hypothetical protein
MPNVSSTTKHDLHHLCDMCHWQGSKTPFLREGCCSFRIGAIVVTRSVPGRIFTEFLCPSSSPNGGSYERTILYLEIINDAAWSPGSSSQNVSPAITTQDSADPNSLSFRARGGGHDNRDAPTGMNVRMRGGTKRMRPDGAHRATQKFRRCNM